MSSPSPGPSTDAARCQPWPWPWPLRLAPLLMLVLALLTALPRTAPAQTASGDPAPAPPPPAGQAGAGPRLPQPAGLWWFAQARLSSPLGERAVALPHRIDSAELDMRQPRAFRYALVLWLDQAPQRPLAVYVPKLSLSAQLLVNGQEAGRCAEGPLALARCLHQPQLFVVPAALWQAGENRLTLQLWGDDRQPSGLSQVAVGDTATLAALHRVRRAWQVELLHALAVALLTAGAVSLALAASRATPPAERRSLLLFGLAGLVNAACDLNFLVVEPPVGRELYSWFTYVARLQSLPLFVLTLLALHQQLTPRRLQCTVLLMVLMALAVAASGNDRRLVQLLYLPLGLGASAAFIFTGHQGWRRRSRRLTLMAAVSLLLLAAGWWDFAKVQGALAFERPYLLPYAYPATLLVMASLMARWMAQALAAQQARSRTLQALLAEREARLLQAHAAMRALEHARIRDEERDALLAHVHDGLGSQLVTARVALESGELPSAEAAEILRQCSEDLRLVLDTLGGVGSGLEPALAEYRHRLAQRLRGRAPALHWTLQLQGMPALAPAQLLQLLRIVQEATHNALRHAGARTLQLEARWQPVPGELVLRVSDDGCGFSAAAPGPAHGEALRRGRGLGSMARRARALGAELQVDGQAPGTRVWLRWRPSPGSPAATA